MNDSPNSHAVLVVDDDRDGADTLVMLLRDFGLDARAAYSAADAARVVQDGFRPGALVLDIGLPDLDGFEVAHDLCAALPYRPLLVALTGHAHLEERSRREGINHHVLKPAEPSELLAVLVPSVPPRSPTDRPPARGWRPALDIGIELPQGPTPAPR
jgi:CheY-like chemotaxis protein